MKRRSIHARLPIGFGAALVLAVLATGCSGKRGVAGSEALLRGDHYVTLKQYPQAIIEYRRALQADGRSPEAHRRLAEAYLLQHQGEDALVEYRRAAELAPDDLRLQLMVGSFLQEAGAYDDAKKHAETVLAKDANNVDALILRGQALLQLGDSDQAISQIEQSIKLDPTQGRTYTALGTVELARGREEEAKAAFQRAIDLNPKSAQARMAMGFYFWDGNQLAEAEQSFKEALALNPGNLPARRVLASLYLMLNRVPAAEEQLKLIAAGSSEPELKLNLADFYLNLNRLDEAQRVLDDVSSDDRARSRAQERLAIVEFRRKHPVEANRIISDVLHREPGNIDALITKARFLIADSRRDEALEIAKQAVAADPGSAMAHYMLGGLYVGKNNVDEALAAYNTVLKLNPRAVIAYVQVGQLHLALGDPKAALGVANTALRIQPMNPDVRLLQAEALMAGGDLKAAEAQLSVLIRRYPASSAVQTQCGRLAVLKGATADATKCYQRALELSPQNRNALDGLVALSVRANRPSEGGRLVETRLAASPNDPLLLMLMANVHEAERNLPAAEAVLKKVIAIDPANLTAYGRLGRLYIQLGRLDEAREEFAKAGARQPTSIAALTMVGLILEAQNKKSEARQQYERIMELDPNAAVAANNLAWLYAESGENLDVALALAQKAKEHLSSNAGVNDTLGWIYYAKNLPALAVPLLEESVRQDPAIPSYHYHLGLAYARTGAKAKAAVALGEALKRNPNYREALDARKALTTRD